jgi:hypothetical protein
VPRPSGPTLGANSLVFEPFLQGVDISQLEEAIKHQPDGLGFVLVDDEGAGHLAGRRVVTEGRRSAHPHPFGFGRGDLVTNALAGDFALELGERKKDVQRQTTQRHPP